MPTSDLVIAGQRSIFGHFSGKSKLFTFQSVDVGKTTKDSGMELSRACSLGISLQGHIHFEEYFLLLSLHIVWGAARSRLPPGVGRSRRRAADVNPLSRYGLRESTVACIYIKMKPIRLKLTSDSSSGPKEAPLCIKIAYKSA